MNTRNKITDTFGDNIFYFIVDGILMVALIMVLFPLLNVFASAFSSGNAIMAGKVYLWPVDFSLEGFKAVFKNNSVIIGYGNTIIYTLLGTLINVAVTLIAAYPLSRDDLPGKNKLMIFFIFTMFFNGGLIPNYILMKNLGFINTRLAIIIPGAVSVWNIIITRTFFQSNIPNELREASYLDGCSDFNFFRLIVIPLSGAIIAVDTLFCAVGKWNEFFNAFIYLNDKNLFPLQLVLREILIQNSFDQAQYMQGGGEILDAQRNLAALLKYSLIIVACVPLWCAYPFVQKHFVKGVMIGSIKG